MYWAMLTLTGVLSVSIALQLLTWLWGIYPGVVAVVVLVGAILGIGVASWRTLCDR
jgi:hypothetical protein